MKSWTPASTRDEIQKVFQGYTSGQTTLLRFLHKEQMELEASQETAESLIDRYEIEETGEWRESSVLCQTARCSLLRMKIWLCSLWTGALSRYNANLVITEVEA